MTFTPQQYNLYFSLLRNALWGDDVAPLMIEKGMKWGAVLKNMDLQGLLPVIAESVFRLPEDLRPKKKMADEIRLQRDGLVEGHQMFRAAIREIFDAFEQEGLHPVLLKGEGLAEYYPIPDTRSCGDIDIYFPQDEYDRACKIIKRLNEGIATPEEDHEDDHHMQTFYGPIVVEIHRRAGTPTSSRHADNYHRLSEENLKPEHCRQMELPGEGRKVYAPDMQYNVLYTFNHLCHHFLDTGLGIRQFCDWALLLHAAYGKIDLQQLKADLTDSGLLRSWQVLGGVVVKQLGLSEEEFPFYDEQMARKSQGKVLEEFIRSGNFAAFDEEKLHYQGMSHNIKRKVLATIDIFRRARLMHKVYPYEALRWLKTYLWLGVVGLKNIKED